MLTQAEPQPIVDDDSGRDATANCLRGATRSFTGLPGVLTRSEVQSHLAAEPRFDDIMCSLRATSKQPKGMLGEIRKVVALSRKFNREVAAPRALAIDRRAQADPTFIPREIMEEANRWGFFSLWIPKLFGGQGYNFPSMSYFAEEASSTCLGIANLIGVHYLGIAGLMATGNTRLIRRVCREVVAGERTGRPCTMALAITEPGAGTDVEEMELIDKANVACHCQKVAGGYKVNGTKVFISNGALAQWHIIIAYEDLKRPSETPVWFLVKTGTKGFTVGRQEVKMGQKACPANELIFDNCFIPDEDVCIDTRQLTPRRRSAKNSHMQMVDYVVSATRAAVGAFGTGVARAALAETLRFAAATRVNGARLIDSEWVQCRLADMYRNVATSRLLYVETNYANGLDGFYKLLQIKPFYYYNKWMPRAYFERVIGPLLDKPWFMALYRKAFFDWQRDDDFHRTSGWASIAKFAGTDAGIQNCQMAIEIMGAAGLRHSHKVEKCLRDAKLLQIYEGTNQLNRLNAFKCLIHRQVPDATVFDE